MKTRKKKPLDEKTTRILAVLALAASSVLFATPSQAVPTVNISIDCSLAATENDQPVGNGWAIVTTFTNCTGISPNFINNSSRYHNSWDAFVYVD